MPMCWWNECFTIIDVSYSVAFYFDIDACLIMFIKCSISEVFVGLLIFCLLLKFSCTIFISTLDIQFWSELSGLQWMPLMQRKKCFTWAGQNEMWTEWSEQNWTCFSYHIVKILRNGSFRQSSVSSRWSAYRTLLKGLWSVSVSPIMLLSFDALMSLAWGLLDISLITVIVVWLILWKFWKMW